MRNNEWHRKLSRGLARALLVFLLLGSTIAPVVAIEYRPLPLAPQSGLSKDWLIHDARNNKLVLFLPGYHAPAYAYYQWVDIRPNRPFRVTFVARKNLSIFLDNRLLFRAQAPGAYSLNLAQSAAQDGKHGQRLLCVWHPELPPDYASFVSNAPVAKKAVAASAVAWWRPQARLTAHQGENVFLCFLLLIGLMYGGIRTVYRPGFARIYELWSNAPGEQNFLTRPTITWLNLLLVVVFALSFSLLIVAIHTNVQSLVLLKQLFAVSESGIVTRVLLYAALIVAFVLLKAVYISLMGYIFDLSGLVLVQYREFVRSLLFMGLFLPIVMLLYLVLNQTLPEGMLWVSNGVVSMMLLATVFRIARTIHRRTSLLNLHLFSYLCATEIIPLTVLLKLLVVTY